MKNQSNSLITFHTQLKTALKQTHSVKSLIIYDWIKPKYSFGLGVRHAKPGSRLTYALNWALVLQTAIVAYVM